MSLQLNQSSSKLKLTHNLLHSTPSTVRQTHILKPKPVSIWIKMVETALGRLPQFKMAAFWRENPRSGFRPGKNIKARELIPLKNLTYRWVSTNTNKQLRKKYHEKITFLRLLAEHPPPPHHSKLQKTPLRHYKCQRDAKSGVNIVLKIDYKAHPSIDFKAQVLFHFIAQMHMKFSNSTSLLPF